MNHEQFLLVKLMEECSEVTQRASKMFQFGGNEVQPGQEKSNTVRLQEEVDDLINVLLMLGFYTTPTRESFHAKSEKIDKYLRYSLDLGTIELKEKVFAVY
jgi:hypothetical protein